MVFVWWVTSSEPSDGPAAGWEAGVAKCRWLLETGLQVYTPYTAVASLPLRLKVWAAIPRLLFLL